MPSLKEIKGRINSVRGTLKITSAMKLVSSSKLRRAQTAMAGILPYQDNLVSIFSALKGNMATDGQAAVLTTPREKISRVAVIAVASNSSLCGGFNSNVKRRFRQELDNLFGNGYGEGQIDVYPIGRKIADFVKKCGLTPVGDYNNLSEKPSYEDSSALSRKLVKEFLDGRIDKVILIYTHLVSTSSQKVLCKTYLPMPLDGDCNPLADVIVEPSPQQVVEQLLPMLISLELYSALLDADAAQHAARTVAMQSACDNAGSLLEEITLQYNKTRQYAITSEILDLAAGQQQ